MPFAWPTGFARVPDEDWTHAPVDDFARAYDALETHSWYENLDPTVDELRDLIQDGDIVVDYSGGTGILARRALAAMPQRAFGVIIVDSSAKFLRLALERLRDEPRAAMRIIRWRKDARRLEYVDEVLGASLAAGGVDALVSTNAIHLYLDLDGTLASWRRVLRPGGRVLVQSGNVLPDAGSKGDHDALPIIDSTVEAVHRAAMEIVREDASLSPYRATLDDAARLAAHDALRARYFVPPRPVAFYREAFETTGFHVVDVKTRPVTARVDEWSDFLAAYHEGILSWIGGSERVEGKQASDAAIHDRLDVLTRAVARVFDGSTTFRARWTYFTCEAP